MSRPLAARRWRGFRGHLLVFVQGGAFLVVVWAVIDVHGFFWLVFLVAGWGIGVVMKACDACWRPQLTGQAIHPDRETSRTGQRRRVSGSCRPVRPDPARHRACVGGGAWEMEEFV